MHSRITRLFYPVPAERPLASRLLGRKIIGVTHVGDMQKIKWSLNATCIDCALHNEIHHIDLDTIQSYSK